MKKIGNKGFMDPLLGYILMGVVFAVVWGTFLIFVAPRVINKASDTKKTSTEVKQESQDIPIYNQKIGIGVVLPGQLEATLVNKSATPPTIFRIYSENGKVIDADFRFFKQGEWIKASTDKETIDSLISQLQKDAQSFECAGYRSVTCTAYVY